MSNLVKQSQLSEVALALWEKVKQKTDVAFKNATYDKATQTITFTKIDDTTVEVPLTDLVSKSNANVITGETLITDGYILGGIISKLDNQQVVLSPAQQLHHFGLKSAQVRTGQKLTHITIGIHDSIAVGTQITGIKVGAIKVSDNTISHYVVNDATATVQENKNTQLTNCTRAVVVPLDTPFEATEDTWFCVTCLHATWGERTSEMFQEDACSEGGRPDAVMPNIGSPVRVKRSGFLGKYLLHTDKISLNEIANITNGTVVKKVNNQLPDSQGNVTVGIDHIPDLQTELDKIKENFVEHWGDLKYTTGYKYDNLLNYDSRVQGKFFPTQNSGDVQNNTFWSIFHYPVRPNEEYTVLRRYEDSGRFVFYNAQGGVEQVLELNRSNLVNGWHRNYVQVPNNSNIAHMAFCFQTYSDTVNSKGRIMLLKASNVREELDSIPYLPNEKVIIDGDKVFIQFNNSGTSLQSNNLVGAVKELNGKITNAGGGTVNSVNNQNPNPQGNVTLDGTHINANVNGSNATVQNHLTNINTTLNSTRTTVNDNANRLTKLETKVPTVKVGDIISTFQDSGSQYTVGGVTYLYIGQTRTIQHVLYPQLASALGISGATNYQLPVISDTNYTFDNGARRRNRKYYIVANVAN